MNTEPDVDASDTAGDGSSPAAPGGPPSSSGVRKGLLIGVIGVGLLLVGLGLAISDGDDKERVALSAGTNLAVTADADDLTAHNSPTVVVDPTDPDTMVVAARIDRPQLSAAVHRSDDGGRTWSSLDVPLPEGEVRAFAPDVAFDAQGRLYVSFITLSDPANNPTAVWLSRSTSPGSALGQPVKVAGPYAYQPRLAVDPSSQAVYVTFVQASAAVETVRNGFGPPPNPVVAATSTDGGRTFSAPVEVSPSQRERVGAATPVVGSAGRLYVLYQDFGEDAADLEGRPGRSVHDGRFSIVLAGSDDRGATFDEIAVVDGDVVPTERFNPYYPKSSSIAVDRADGTLYVAWADGDPDDTDVFVRRSTTDGTTWGPRIRVGGARSASGTDQLLPSVSVAPGGRVDVAFLDGSVDSGNLLAGAVLATSFDRGRTWQKVVVSDRLFDPRVGPPSVEPDEADLGSRIGVVSRRDGVMAVWTDTRKGSVDTGRQDVYFAPVRIVRE